MRASSAGGAPSTPSRIRLAALPDCSSRNMKRLAGVRPVGRNSVMSVRTSTHRNTPTANATASSRATKSGSRFKAAA